MRLRGVHHITAICRDLNRTIGFYRDVLGFAVMAQLGPQAVFLSAGGYHHHFGGNTWESAGAPPAPPGTARLRHATIVLRHAADRERIARRLERAGYPTEQVDGGVVVSDPSGNALLLAVA